VSEPSLSASVASRSTPMLWIKFGTLLCLVWFLPFNPLHTPLGHTFHADSSDIRNLHTPRNQSALIYLPSRSISHWISQDAQVPLHDSFSKKNYNISRFAFAFCIQCISFISQCRLRVPNPRLQLYNFQNVACRVPNLRTYHHRSAKSDTLAL